MKVWVGSSKLPYRILNASQASGRIDGAQASAAIETRLYERKQADLLLAGVLKDYPYRAFDIDVKRTSVSMDNNRTAYLNIPFEIRLTKNFVMSLWAALEPTATDRRANACYNSPDSQWGCNSRAYVQVVRDSRSATAGFPDDGAWKELKQGLYQSYPKILLTLKNTQNQVVYQKCQENPDLNQLFVSYNAYPQARVDGDQILNSGIKMPVTAQSVQDLATVDLKIVRKLDCPI